MNNTVVIIDGGGRGAALVHAYSKSPHVQKIIAIPGNDLMQLNSAKPVITYQNLKTTSVDEIVQICKKEANVLVDVAQDNAVAVGLVDALKKEKIRVFGPTKKAGEIEWNKAWARDFMKRHKIAQPEYFIFTSVEKAKKFLATQKDQPWFVKASGLAEGKGALPADNNTEAANRIEELQKFGESAKTFLLEKWIKSENKLAEEFSTFLISDGRHFQILGSAQDHKRALDGDKGENTGGMGVSSPPLVLSKEILGQVDVIAKKTIDGLKNEKRPYVGILYIGGIIIKEQGKEKVYMIEYNARWGDPEAEVIIPGISNDFYELIKAALDQKINKIKITLDNKARVAVAGAAKGYPEDYSAVKGKEIFGIESAKKQKNIILYGAGVKRQRGSYIVNGGRLFYVVGSGGNVLEAREKAYKALKEISVEGNNLHFRTDIGWRDVKRLRKNSKSS